MAWLLLASPTVGQVYRWDNGQLIPGTEDLMPGRAQQLSNLDLSYGDGLRVEHDESSTASVKILHSSFENGDDGMDLSEIDSIRIIHTSAENNDGQGLEVDDSGSIHVVGAQLINNDEGLEIDDAESARIVGGTFAENTDEGLDIDNVSKISVINVSSHGHEEGSGLQVEADEEDSPISSVKIVNSNFDNNGEDGVQIVVDDGSEIENLKLNGNSSKGNAGYGYNIDPVGKLKSHGNDASGNADDTIP